MYNKPDIKKTISDLLEESPISLNTIVETIINFINEFSNKQAMESVFEIEEIEEMGNKLALWNTSKNRNIEDFINILKSVPNSTLLTNSEKEDFITNFAKHFCECSEDEDYCDGKVYVIIKNLSSDNTNDIVKEFDNWKDAEYDIDEAYIGCCDDYYLAENMWFEILCYVRAREADEYKNFCSIVEFDAEGLEEAREFWEDD
jgi:hypothetical protein